MISDWPPEGSPLFPEDIDLSDIFIGREQQLDQFRFYLERWQRLAAADPLPDLKAPPSPNDKIQGFVVLLHGRGGFGKSTLLKRYREIALEYGPAVQISDLIDWEFAAQERRALFNPAQGEDIDASHYFGFMRDQLALALDKQRTDFKDINQQRKLLMMQENKQEVFWKGYNERAAMPGYGHSQERVSSPSCVQFPIAHCCSAMTSSLKLLETP